MLHRWHRRIGIVVVIVIVIVCATGLLLNHTGTFDLDARYVSNRLLLNRYNVGAPEPAGGIHLGGHWIVQLGHRVYFDSVESLSGTEGLVSAIVQGGLLVVAFDNEVVVYAETGDIVDRLTAADGAPALISRVGHTATDLLAVEAAGGVYQLDLENARFTPLTSGQIVSWNTVGPVPDDVAQRVAKLYRGKGLTLEKLVLDIHSGRIAGNIGVLIVDAVTLAMIFLSITGVVMWMRPPRSGADGDG
jgi:hypothetical protein